MLLKPSATCTGLVMIIVFMISSCGPFLVRDYRGDADNYPVRILIVKAAGSVTISSKSAMKISRNSMAINAPIGSVISGTYTPWMITCTLKIEPGNDPILVNGQPYRGSMILRRQNESLQVINLTVIDEYLLSVVPGEIPASWDRESLKAQAVAARTFTYYHLKSGNDRDEAYDLDATAATQVYRGMNDEKPQTTEAVRATAGQIMVYDGKPILSYFHSTCGGKTVDARYVWEKSRLPYLQGVTCGFCKDSTKYNWEATLNIAEIRSGLMKKYPAIGSISAVSFRKKDDRVVEVAIAHSRGVIRMNGNDFRLLFPAEKIRSLYFVSKKEKDRLVLKGHGWGHGVGLCQWGARGMAMRGYDYKDILRHYYTGVSIKSVRTSYIASKQRNLSSYQ
ncbi:MAG TPA: SpoIID/LytB domain-containing protein [Spirochaetota bacterium]|mgnify:FL=1|nr:SpoIID/LytB domain-containing protein [Spirochaetota bacterium]HPV40639.1 SpoIID/LytB domain-containing protein [Spirochaetota bacterium]